SMENRFPSGNIQIQQDNALEVFLLRKNFTHSLLSFERANTLSNADSAHSTYGNDMRAGLDP
ncbi:hypothetical protein, partial [Paenibacillus sp. J23TS9]|uniref:hypothetical protein n=1 Tax=Paenibacillus sp. J23TS9 TaxID=2807193 RepID=UPI001BCCC37F